jgi:pyruvate carboxylase
LLPLVNPEMRRGRLQPTVFYGLNGQPREVTVRNKSLQPSIAARAEADPSDPGQVGGADTRGGYQHQRRSESAGSKGDRPMVMRATKMQTPIYVPISGPVTKKLANVGQNVDAKDLLMVISAAAG